MKQDGFEESQALRRVERVRYKASVMHGASSIGMNELSFFSKFATSLLLSLRCSALLSTIEDITPFDLQYCCVLKEEAFIHTGSIMRVLL